MVPRPCPGPGLDLDWGRAIRRKQAICSRVFSSMGFAPFLCIARLKQERMVPEGPTFPAADRASGLHMMVFQVCGRPGGYVAACRSRP